MKHLRWLMLLCLILLTGTSATYAYEEFAEKTGLDCAVCHVDPSGGAELTATGKGYSLSLESANALDGDREKVGKSNPTKIFKLLVGFIHMFTAFFWFGTILYVHIVLKPAYASKGLPPGEVKVGLLSIVIMGITGSILTYYRVPSVEFLVTTRFGILLSLKIGLFLFLVLSALFVVLFIGPRLKAKKGGKPTVPGDMSLVDLSSFDGKDGRKALIAFEGNIYDVTESKMWKKGNHMMKHNAGEDLTSQLSQAPHGPEPILERMNVVGKQLPDNKPERALSHKHVFYFMAYLNLTVVIAVIFVISMWRWW